MKTILYHITGIILILLCFLPFTGCEQKKAEEMLSATLSSTTVRQGEVTTVTVEILSGNRQPLPSKDREHATRPTLQADQPQ